METGERVGAREVNRLSDNVGEMGREVEKEKERERESEREREKRERIVQTERLQGQRGKAHAG